MIPMKIIRIILFQNISIGINQKHLSGYYSNSKGKWVTKKKLEFSEEILSVALLSPACYLLLLPTPGEAKAKAMPGRLYIHTK
jgi:hypothetical protein